MGVFGMKMNNTAAGIERRSKGRRARLDALAAQMHADYLTPMTMAAVARKWNTDSGTVRAVFKRNGIAMRAFKPVARQANGSPVRYVPFTEAEIAALIAKQKRVSLPAELRFEWRTWSLEKRAAFIARLRAQVDNPPGRPETPFSSNVTPFDYGTPAAHEIARRMNKGRDSRTKIVAIKPCSQGVIYEGQLYFWSLSGGTAYFIGPWRPGVGRPPLHRLLWEKFNRRKLPPGSVVRQADGNRNNFARGNLVLATKNDICRENQAAALAKKSRALTTLLLNRHTQGKSHVSTDLISSLAKNRRPAANR